MNESFKDLYNWASDEDWEFWRMEKKGIHVDMNHLVQRWIAGAMSVIENRKKRDVWIEAISLSDRAIKWVEEDIAWDIHNTGKILNSIINRVEHLPDVLVRETPPKRGRIIISAASGRLITRDIVQKITELLEKKIDEEVEGEPIILDAITTIFKDRDQLLFLIASSKWNARILMSTDKNTNYVVMYSNAPLWVMEVSYVLWVGILPSSKSVNSAIDAINELNLSLPPESRNSLKYLKSLYHSLQ